MLADNASSTHALHVPKVSYWLLAFTVTALLWGCVQQPKTAEQQAANFIAEHSKGAIDGSAQSNKNEAATHQLPLRYQRPAYSLDSKEKGTASHTIIPVGAKITPSGPKSLRLVLQELAKLKSMNISWANDVDKDALVDVTIMPEEDFFEAIDNVLRQLDYFHEMEGNTIVVKHKETKKFHIAMPFTASSYSTSVGGDVLGNAQGGNMTGTLQLSSNDNKFDIWTNIQKNLDKILEIWSLPPQPVVAAAPSAPGAPQQAPGQQQAPAPAAQAPPQQAPAGGGGDAASALDARRSGLGYYTIDRPIGLITVTAPRSLLGKIESYLTNLREEMYRQVSIEAKIIEVTLSSDNTTGVNWDSLFNTSLGFNMNFQKIAPNIYTALSTESSSVTDSFTTEDGWTKEIESTSTTDSSTAGYQKFLTMNSLSFSALIDAMEQQGHVEVLSNPKISVMNGQPAMISVGQNVTYVKQVSSTTDSQTGTVTYTVTPDSVMSGLGMGVIATILDNNEIVLTITPVTSALTQPIEYKTFGGNNQVGLPKVNLREMNTMVRVKSGEMLVIGGLIDDTSAYNNDAVVGLGKLPGMGKLFRADGTATNKKELIVLMRPQLIEAKR